ncbi:hypothetical protein DFJ73DRAFT_966369 [Zopfochytrium polystomum]|nr:hypothetical protein DFJ73DRAFT_966369 [Zopfochytrium polystomum]
MTSVWRDTMRSVGSWPKARSENALPFPQRRVFGDAMSDSLANSLLKRAATDDGSVTFPPCFGSTSTGCLSNNVAANRPLVDPDTSNLEDLLAILAVPLAPVHPDTALPDVPCSPNILVTSTTKLTRPFRHRAIQPPQPTSHNKKTDYGPPQTDSSAFSVAFDVDTSTEPSDGAEPADGFTTESFVADVSKELQQTLPGDPRYALGLFDQARLRSSSTWAPDDGAASLLNAGYGSIASAPDHTQFNQNPGVRFPDITTTQDYQHPSLTFPDVSTSPPQFTHADKDILNILAKEIGFNVSSSYFKEKVALGGTIQDGHRNAADLGDDHGNNPGDEDHYEDENGEDGDDDEDDQEDEDEENGDDSHGDAGNGDDWDQDSNRATLDAPARWEPKDALPDDNAARPAADGEPDDAAAGASSVAQQTPAVGVKVVGLTLQQAEGNALNVVWDEKLVRTDINWNAGVNDKQWRRNMNLAHRKDLEAAIEKLLQSHTSISAFTEAGMYTFPVSRQRHKGCCGYLVKRAKSGNSYVEGCEGCGLIVLGQVAEVDGKQVKYCRWHYQCKCGKIVGRNRNGSPRELVRHVLYPKEDKAVHDKYLEDLGLDRASLEVAFSASFPRKQHSNPSPSTAEEAEEEAGEGASSAESNPAKRRRLRRS